MRGVFLALALIGCSGADDSTAAGAPESTSACPPGQRWLVDRCLDAGVQDNGCPAGEVLRSEGACAPAGVPPEACAPGFEPFEDGCAAILPSAPCSPGRMATPGETVCREVAPCGTDKWGAIAVEPNTEYVDLEYAGGDSDGSATKPWPSIQTAVEAAESGAIVAIAAGSYDEEVTIIGKQVRLWGRCPDMVAITNGIVLVDGASGCEVRDLAIQSDGVGLGIYRAGEVTVDRVWIHDTSQYGFAAEGPNELSMTRSLVEATSSIGVYVLGGALAVDASVVRDTQPDAANAFGRGINVQIELGSGLRGSATVTGSVVSNNRTDGIFVGAADAVVEATVVRDTQPSAADGTHGGGITVQTGPSVEPASLSVEACVVTGNHYGGIESAGAPVTVVATTVRDTLTQPDGDYGAGLSLFDSGSRATATVTSCAVSGSHGSGVWLDASDAVIEGSVIRDTAPTITTTGRGIYVTEHGTGPSVATVLASVLANNREVGLFVAGSRATVEGVLIRDTQPDANQHAGVGVVVRDHVGGSGEATLAKSVVQNNHDVGVYVSSASAIVDATRVLGTKPALADQNWGAGILIQPSSTQDPPSTLELRDSVVEHNLKNALVVFASHALIDHSWLHDTTAEIATQEFGDGFTIVSYGFPTEALVRASRIETSARAGVANFGAVVSLENNTLECNRIHLDAEPHQGQNPVFRDLGGNRCGCSSEEVACKAVSAGVGAPEPLEPL